MNLDGSTALVAAAVVAGALAAHVSLTTALRRPEPATFAWSAGFLALASAAGVAALTGTSTGGARVVVEAAVLGALVLGVGLLWLGAHRFDDRDGHLAPWVGAGATTAAAAALVLPADPGLAVAALLVAGAGAGCVRTLATRPGGGTVDTRLAVAAGLGLVVVAAVVGVVALSADVSARTLTAVLVLAACGPFGVMVALSFYGQQSLRSASRAVDGRRDDEGALSVLDRTTFWRVASHRLERARNQDGTTLSLVLASVADLDEIRTVYGSPAARRTVSHVAAVIARQVPVSSEVGHLGAGRFAVLSIVVPGRSSDTVVEAIGTGLFGSAVSEQLPVRAACTFLSADTSRPDLFDELFDRAAPPSDPEVCARRRRDRGGGARPRRPHLRRS